MKTKIGLASICLLGLATSHVAANETEVAKTSQDTTTASSSSEQNQSSNKTQTSAEVQTNAAAHWDGDYYVKDDGSKAQSEELVLSQVRWGLCSSRMAIDWK
ncbi:1,4-beta-N-acetylmuramidase [Streptococcus pneumoniae]|nr:1,4-beta-N-acetylmuramidase [Streptococcus pneumoniae]